EPSILGAVRDQDHGTTLFVSSSPLRGLTLDRADQSVSLIGLSSLDAARLRQDVEQGLGSPMVGLPFETTFTDDKVAAGLQPPAEETEKPKPNPRELSPRVDPSVKPDQTRISNQPDYARILERIADRYAAMENVDLRVSPELLERLDKDYKSLREEL